MQRCMLVLVFNGLRTKVGGNVKKEIMEVHLSRQQK